MTEDEILSQYHRARLHQLAHRVSVEMQSAAVTGIFEDEAECASLWDEVCWALCEHSGELPDEAAQDTIVSFSRGVAMDLLKEELVLHAYLLTDLEDEEGMPFPDQDAVTRAIADEVAELCSERDLSELLALGDDDEDWEEKDGETVMLPDPEPAKWMLSKADHDALSAVRDELWDWSRSACTGNDLMALGAAVGALDGMLGKEERVWGSIVLECVSQPKATERKTVKFTLGDEGLELAITRNILTEQGISSDHDCETLARLTWKGGFNVPAIELWRKEACRVRTGNVWLLSEILSLTEYRLREVSCFRSTDPRTA